MTTPTDYFAKCDAVFNALTDEDAAEAHRRFAMQVRVGPDDWREWTPELAAELELDRLRQRVIEAEAEAQDRADDQALFEMFQAMRAHGTINALQLEVLEAEEEQREFSWMD